MWRVIRASFVRAHEASRPWRRWTLRRWTLRRRVLWALHSALPLRPGNESLGRGDTPEPPRRGTCGGVKDSEARSVRFLPELRPHHLDTVRSPRLYSPQVALATSDVGRV
jgi:hypothetical protein